MNHGRSDFSVALLLGASVAITAALEAQTPRPRRVEPVATAQAASYRDARRVAVVVGLSKYTDAMGFAPLVWAAQDASAVAEELERQGYTVRLLRNEEASRGLVMKTLQDAAALLRDDGTFVFFFAGHGFSPDGRANYLATWGTTDATLVDDGLSLDAVRGVMGRSGARRKVLWVDACRNQPGRAAGGRSFASLAAARGVRMLLSTGAGRIAYESDALHGGVFTHFLLAGLKGAAAGADGLVTFRDLADYVSREVETWSFSRGQLQQPVEISDEAAGDFLIATGPSSPTPRVASLRVDPADILTAATDALDADCRSGSGSACDELGVRYQRGRSVAIDSVRAAGYFQRAVGILQPECDRGLMQSCARLASMHVTGRGVTADQERALALQQRACDGGFGIACNTLASRYQVGAGVPKDEAKAAILAQRAVGLLQPGCDAGDMQSCLFLAIVYVAGRGVTKDETKAAALNQRVCDAGHARGCAALARAYAAGSGLASDETRAFSLYERACQGGDVPSCLQAGVRYGSGLGASRDDVRAVGRYQIACEGAVARACAELGQMYADGRGVPQDRSKAIEMYRRACDARDQEACEAVKRLTGGA